MDGDRVPSGALVSNAMAWMSLTLAVAGVNGAWWHRAGLLGQPLRRLCSFQRGSAWAGVKGHPRPSGRSGCLMITIQACLLLVLSTALAIGVGLRLTWAVPQMAPGGGMEAELALPVEGQYSKFTLICPSYAARLRSLKLWVRHYSRCPSVGGILVIWNQGAPPPPSAFDSAVPLRVRIEAENLLTNRFKPDPEIRTRAVLSLDDDIFMRCASLETAFAEWRKNPSRLVGFHPRLVLPDASGRLVYRGEKFATRRGRYNVVLAGAAFIDAERFFPLYHSPALEPARAAVNAVFNGEDLLLNFLVANETQTGQAVQVERAVVRVHAWQLSGVGLSRNELAHYAGRDQVLARLMDIFGGNPLREVGMNGDAHRAEGRLPRRPQSLP